MGKILENVPERFGVLERKLAGIPLGVCLQGHPTCRIQAHYVVTERVVIGESVGHYPPAMLNRAEVMAQGVKNAYLPGRHINRHDRPEPDPGHMGTVPKVNKKGEVVYLDLIEATRRKMLKVWAEADTDTRTLRERAWGESFEGPPQQGGYLRVQYKYKRNRHGEIVFKRDEYGKIVADVRAKRTGDPAGRPESGQRTDTHKVQKYGHDFQTGTPYAEVRVYGCEPAGIRVHLSVIKSREHAVKDRIWAREIREAVAAYLKA